MESNGHSHLSHNWQASGTVLFHIPNRKTVPYLRFAKDGLDVKDPSVRSIPCECSEVLCRMKWNDYRGEVQRTQDTRRTG
jgi:hypothetical protein